MNKTVERPQASAKKIKTSEDFELCYIRHQYFRRVKYNPTEAEMEPYMKIVAHLTKNTFYTYINLFKAVGMYHDDVLNIGRVHLVSFLGLYALERMEEKKKLFVEKFEKNEYRTPTENDFDQKNKANFTMFFKQRMEDLVRVCRQKVRNIKGLPSEECIVFCGPARPPKYPKRLLREFNELGFKKIEYAVFKSIRKKIQVDHDAMIFQFGGQWYVAIPVEHRSLDAEDIVGSGYNPYENAHNMRPDDLYEEKELDRYSCLFNKKSILRKRVTLRNFIAKNRGKAHYKEEVATAKRLLRNLGE